MVAEKKMVAIYGAGGHAREVAWLLETLPEYEVVEYVEDDSKDNRVVNGKPVVSWNAFSHTRAPQEILVAVAIGSPSIREKIAAKCSHAGYSFATLVHRSVEMSSLVELGAGSIVCCGSILTVNIQIEQHVHINLDCTISHDVKIGEFSTLAPSVHRSGNVHVGRRVYIGTGASVINGTSEKPLVLGDGTVIGAGACITGNTEPNSLYAGVPAVFKKYYA